MLLVVIIFGVTKINKIFSKEEIINTSSSETIKAKVEVLEIQKEKEKPDIYVIKFTTTDKGDYANKHIIKLNLPKNIYEERIGADNNIVNLTISNMKFRIEKTSFVNSGVAYGALLDISRYSLNGEGFTNEEIEYFNKESLDSLKQILKQETPTKEQPFIDDQFTSIEKSKYSTAASYGITSIWIVMLVMLVGFLSINKILILRND